MSPKSRVCGPKAPLQIIPIILSAFKVEIVMMDHGHRLINHHNVIKLMLKTIPIINLHLSAFKDDVILISHGHRLINYHNVINFMLTTSSNQFITLYLGWFMTTTRVHRTTRLSHVLPRILANFIVMVVMHTLGNRVQRNSITPTSSELQPR